CGSGAPDASGATGTPPAAADLAATASPALRLDNCGVTTSVEAPPQRVVTVKSSTFELLLALGLADRVVGAAFLDGAVPERWAADAADVPVVADAAPGREAVLALEPDMVFAGWESTFSADGVGERAELERAGVLTYVAPAACRGAGRPVPLTFETVFEHVLEAGDVFGVPDAAAALVEEQRAALAAVEPDTRGLRALWYSSGADVPYVGAGIGAPAMIMDAVGLENVAAEVQDSWTPFGWEQVVEADPDVIVLVDATWNSAQQKIDLLEAHPTASRLAAVREQRYLVVPFAATEAGVRNVDAAARLAQELAAIEVPDADGAP
ncbi:iron transporter, partial [Actinotalea ferrariae CF5-4]